MRIFGIEIGREEKRTCATCVFGQRMEVDTLVIIPELRRGGKPLVTLPLNYPRVCYYPVFGDGSHRGEMVSRKTPACRYHYWRVLRRVSEPANTK